MWRTLCVSVLACLAVFGCATRGVEEARTTLATSERTAWSLRAASDEIIVSLSPAQKTLSLLGSSGIVLGTSISAVSNDKHARRMREALQDYDPGAVFEEWLSARLTEVLGDGQVAPMTSIAGQRDRRTATAMRCERLAEAGYQAVLDLKTTYGIFGPAGTLLIQIDGVLHELPGGHVRWADTITVQPGPVLAGQRLGDPTSGMMPDLGQNLLTVEEEAVSQWTRDGGARFQREFQAGIEQAVSGLLCTLGLIDETIGQYQRALEAMAAKEFAEAEEILGRVIEIDPNFVDARNALCVCKAEAGRVDDAIVAATEILTTEPDYGPAHYNLAWWLAIDKEDPASARPYYERSLLLGMPISPKIEKRLDEKT